MDLFHIVNRLTGERTTGFSKKTDAKVKRDELNKDHKGLTNYKTKKVYAKYYIARGSDNI